MEGKGSFSSTELLALVMVQSKGVFSSYELLAPLSAEIETYKGRYETDEDKIVKRGRASRLRLKRELSNLWSPLQEAYS